MSLNPEPSFGGVLLPLLETLTRTPRKESGLRGQEVVLPHEDVTAVLAIDGEDNIHLLLSPVTTDDVRYTKLDLKGLKIVLAEWAVGERPVQNYLDVSCLTGALPSFKRPFLRFAEDLLYEISQPGASPADALYRTGLRWKKFWSADISATVSRDWLHGLFGELLFLIDLIDRFGPCTINYWAGPLGLDHDFQVDKALAVEVKTCIEVPLQIHCNINQLDPTLFTDMYLACYKLTVSDQGRTLSQLVREVEKLTRGDLALLDAFYERLAAVGYTPQFETAYNEFTLEYSPVAMFKIDENMPKITGGSFSLPVDHRISNIRYTLELSGLKESSFEDVAGQLKRFA